MPEIKDGQREQEPLSGEYIDITNGTPFATGQELITFLVNEFEGKEIARHPILGVKDNNNSLAVYMLLKDVRRNHQTHEALNEKLNDPIHTEGKLVFASGLEGFTSSSEFSIKPRLKISGVKLPGIEQIFDMYISLTKQSDFVNISGSGLNDIGKEKMREIFTKIPGLSFEDEERRRG